MKVCKNCNAKNDDSARYCRQCGELLENNQSKRKPQKDVSGWWYLLAFILFLLWIGLKARIISF